MPNGIETGLVPDLATQNGSPQLRIELGFGPRIKASVRAAGNDSIDVSLGLNPALPIALSLLANPSLGAQQLRESYKESRVMIRLSLDKKGIEAVLRDSNIARRLESARINLYPIEWEQNKLAVDVERVGTGRARLRATVSADERQRILIVNLEESSLPGGVWPAELTISYPRVKTSGARLEIDLRDMAAIGWSFRGSTAVLTLVMRVPYLLDFIQGPHSGAGK